MTILSVWYNSASCLPATFAKNFTPMQLKNIIYILACLSFTVICGAAVYEHMVIWPKAFAKLPASLIAFRGEHAMDNGAFWKMIHPVTLVLFIITLITSWRTKRRKHILYSFVIYAAILVTTFAWFVPELLDIIHTPYNNTFDETLTSRGSRWETLSIIRAVILFATAMFLFTGLTKPAVKNAADK